MLGWKGLCEWNYEAAADDKGCSVSACGARGVNISVSVRMSVSVLFVLSVTT